MRIGIDARMWGPTQTGIGRFVDRLLYHMVRMPHGHELAVFALKNKKEALESSLLGSSNLGDRMSIVPVRDRWYGWGEQVRLPVAFYRQQLDVLHVPHFNVPLLYRRPFVVTIHDLTPWDYPGHKMGTSPLRRFLFRRVFCSAVQRAARVVAVSEATRSDIRETVGRNDVRVIHEGPGIIDRDDDTLLDLKTPDTAPKRPFLLALGVWREHKNFARLITAFECLKKQANSEALLVLGGAWHDGDSALVERVRASDVCHDIITPGFLAPADLPAWYAAARAVVVPSLMEGFGFVGLEAMHFGVPVVAARAGSLPEVYGDAALFVDPYDVDALADALRTVMHDVRTRAVLVARGKEQVQRYSWRSMAERMLELYEETAA